MRYKNKISLIYVIIFLVIIFSFAIPKIVIKVQDEKIFTKSYTANKNIKPLNENLNKAKLINTIYSRYNADKYNVTVSDTLQQTQEIIVSGDSKIGERENVRLTTNGEEETLNKIDELIKYNVL